MMSLIHWTLFNMILIIRLNVIRSFVFELNKYGRTKIRVFQFSQDVTVRPGYFRCSSKRFNWTQSFDDVTNRFSHLYSFYLVNTTILDPGLQLIVCLHTKGNQGNASWRGEDLCTCIPNVDRVFISFVCVFFSYVCSAVGFIHRFVCPAMRG